MELRQPGLAGNGWNHVHAKGSCGGTVLQTGIPASVDQATLNGFTNYVNASGLAYAAIYSGPGVWQSIFGTGSYSTVSNVAEWTSEVDTGCKTPGPQDWTQTSGTCGTNSAAFFGGMKQTSGCALVWQWDEDPSVGDFDQIYTSRVRTTSCG